MAKMVDKDKLLAILADRKLSTGRLIQWQYAIEAAEVEVPEIVQCKDCTQWDRNDTVCQDTCYCGELERYTDVGFFCGYGERREDSSEEARDL